MTLPKLRFKEFNGDWEANTIQHFLDKKFILDQMDGNHGELYPKSEEFSSCGIPYVSATDFSSGTLDFSKCKRLPLERAKLFKKGIAKNGDVLFAHNATVGPVAILKTELDFVVLSTTATYYRCNGSFLNNYYLKNYFESDFFVQQYFGIMSQSTRNQVPITTQRKLSISIPIVKEQIKIASFLSAMDEKISQLTQKHELLSQYKQGMMQKLFSQQIRFKSDDGREFGEWEDKPLSELSEKAMYGMNASATEYDGLNKYLRITDICEISHKLKRDNLTSPNAELGEKYKLGYGDLLFARTGASVGKSYLYSVDDGLAYFAGFLIKFSLKLDLVNPYFIFAQTLTSEFDKWVVTNSMRSGQPGINAEEYSGYIFKVPCLEEQAKIANFLSAIDQKIEVVAQQIEQAKQWKKGLLQQMFV
ncbi:hypothetical protein GFH30_03265 [Acinetobacter wanghuae]|uniref:Type I restriction modification DNA specificity domain-containing protein n=1 Tax=Acinetobacter wanghuae TaxID=2662362 RepID=A0A5Q0P020_9GAMM|nr:restriction endonuclease subunit S [Acinetobacter wanghuae]MQW92231.1 hypothetical protein [Acinetobacter wanghuae]QGA10477.1 hypothetical protein GFH30_03265 [Acinetobacter wanghuae]